jgi:hypothetical protein
MRRSRRGRRDKAQRSARGCAQRERAPQQAIAAGRIERRARQPRGDALPEPHQRAGHVGHADGHLAITHEDIVGEAHRHGGKREEGDRQPAREQPRAARQKASDQPEQHPLVSPANPPADHRAADYARQKRSDQPRRGERERRAKVRDVRQLNPQPRRVA